jgi:dsDNA-specific endonuclease/ATPase MutS2
MAGLEERMGIVETKVENLSEKLDSIKTDVKEMHDCLDNTREELKEQLDKMYNASCSQHEAMSKRIGEIEKLKDKWTYAAAGAVAILGWASGHAEKILNFIK